MGSPVTITPDPQPNQPRVTITPDAPSQHESGFWDALGSDLMEVAKSIPKGLVMGSAPGQAYMGIRKAIDDLKAMRQTGSTPDMDRAKQRQNQGYGTAYSNVLAPTGEALGVNVAGMEAAAARGDTGAVAGHAVAGAAPYVAPVVAEGAGKVVQAAAQKVGDTVAPAMYQSALKPPVTAGLDKTAGMVNTGLNNGVPISAAGLDKVGTLIDNLNQRITAVVNSNPSRKVNKFAVASRLSDTADDLSKQVNPEKDLAVVGNSGNEFLRNNPGNIPADLAQAMKVGTYQQLKAKYGQMGMAQVEAEKALARGLKEELATAFPELNDLNAQESRLLDLQPALERAVSRNANHQIIGIGTPIAGGAVALASGSPAAGAIAATIKAVVDNPTVKSKLAIALYRAGKNSGKYITMGQAAAKVSAYSAALTANSDAGGKEAGAQTAEQ